MGALTPTLPTQRLGAVLSAAATTQPSPLTRRTRSEAETPGVTLRGGYVTTVVNLGANVNGQTIKLRFRMGTDEAVGGIQAGEIDNLAITECVLSADANANADADADANADADADADANANANANANTNADADAWVLASLRTSTE